jgi:hypothetical protein
VRLDPKPSHLRHYRPLPLNRFTGAPHADSSLGGGAPAHTIAARVILGARAPSEGALAAVEVRPNRAIAAGPP